tara:strand:- start:163 stop:579 length:417 start_codon:yes stop_codon:yes gene_type:complete
MWYYKGQPYEATEEALKEWVGFVYIITDKSNDKMYVGKKIFWSKKTLPPLKGKTRKRRSIVESDWKSYYGSSDLVKQLLIEHGEQNFHREILFFCRSKGEMGFLEAKEQFARNVLLDDRYYNGIINCRVHRNHVQSLK